MSSIPGVVQYLATAAHSLIPKSKSFLSNLFAGRVLRIVRISPDTPLGTIRIDFRTWPNERPSLMYLYVPSIQILMQTKFVSIRTVSTCNSYSTGSWLLQSVPLKNIEKVIRHLISVSNVWSAIKNDKLMVTC